MDELKKSIQQAKDQDVSIRSDDDSYPETVNAEKKNSIFSSVRMWFYNLKKTQRIAVISGITGIVIVILAVFILILKLDAYLYPSSVSGIVTDVDTQEGIENVRICVKEKCTSSAENGHFVLGSLVYGDVEITVSLTNYHTVTQTIHLSRGRNEYNVTLSPTGYGELSGTLVSTMEEYDYTSVSVLIDEEEITVEQNGSFTLKRIPVGAYKLFVSSADFMDKKIEVTIEDGKNSVGEIALSIAGDVVVKVSDRLNNETIADAKVTFDKNTQKTNSKGETKLKDLTIGKVIVKISAEGYLDKKASISIEQGLNEMKSVPLVKQGKVVYISNRLGNNNVYISNYDGSGEILLTDNVGDSTSPFLSNDNSTVYFLSTREFIKDTSGYYNLKLMYSVPAEGGSITKVSQTNYEGGNGIRSYDFESMKRAYNVVDYVSDPWYYESELFFGNIDGTDTQSILHTKGYIDSYIIANDGSFVIFSKTHYKEGVHSGIFYINTETKATQLLMESDESVYPSDISSNRAMVLVRRYSKASSQWDLWIAGISEDYEVQLTNTSAQEVREMFSPDGSKVSFISSRDGKEDLYVVGVDGQNEVKVTKDGAVDDYFWTSDNMIFYISQKTMWVIDAIDPKNQLKVSEQVGGTYYSEQYYYYD